MVFSRSFLAAALVAGAWGQGITYVTDLALFNSLAPCVSSALSSNFDLLTYSTRCPTASSALQSCVCSISGVRADLSSSLAEDVSSSCSAADQDLSSAYQVYDKYCHPEKTITFSKPSATVTAYITDITETTYLAPCAQSALYQAVAGDLEEQCPQDASLSAPCVCGKPVISTLAPSLVSSAAKDYCSNDADATQALDFFSDFCNLNKGTSSFGTPKGPPGDMTYYVTGLPQFKSLRGCAQSAMSEVVMSQTDYSCAQNPQALASCICIKTGMSRDVSTDLTESVKYSCSPNALGDVSSALDVFNYYCSAANGKVAAKVSDSVSMAGTTARSGAGSPTSSPTGGSGSQDGDSNDNNGGGGRKSQSGNHTGAIAGGVVGGVVVIALVGILGFFIRRKRQRQIQGESLPGTSHGPQGGVPIIEYDGHPELGGDSTYPTNGYSSVKHSELPTPTPSPFSQQQAYSTRPPVSELSSPDTPSYQPYNHQQPHHGSGWQSVPQESYEMDAGVTRR